jgi:hypothetical protein
MLVDIIVSKGEIIAARPISIISPPISLYKNAGVTVLSIKWTGQSSYSSSQGLASRLKNRKYGRLKGSALKEASYDLKSNSAQV